METVLSYHFNTIIKYIYLKYIYPLAIPKYPSSIPLSLFCPEFTCRCFSICLKILIGFKTLSLLSQTFTSDLQQFTLIISFIYFVRLLCFLLF